MLLALTANIHRRKGHRALKPGDFFHFSTDERTQAPDQPPSPAALREQAFGLVTRLGGKVFSRDGKVLQN